MVEKKWRNSLQDVRVTRSADIASNHQLLRAKININLKNNKRTPTRIKFNLAKLQAGDAIKEKFQNELKRN